MTLGWTGSPYTKHVGLPDGSVVSTQREPVDGPAEVICWEYAPVLASGLRWAARGEAAARSAAEQWSSGEYVNADDTDGDGVTYDPVVGIDKRMVSISYGEWERC